MAQAMEYNQSGKREALADVIANVESDATPLASMLAKRKRPGNVTLDWQVKTYRRKGHRGVADGKDATDFNYNGREPMHSVAQKTWDPRGVSDFAEESDVAGVKSELADQTADALVTVKQTIERRLSSNEECSLQNTTNPDGFNETRGYFKWLDKDEQSLYPVPESVRPLDAQLYTGTLANFTEDELKALAVAAWKRRLGNSVTLMGIVGIELKGQVSNFTRYDDTVANKTNVRTFQQDAEAQALINIIDRLVLDTGVINLIPSAHLMTDADTGEDTAYTHKSGLFLDMGMVAMNYTRMPRVKPIEYKGGGYKVIVDAIFMGVFDNPAGCFSARINS